MTRMTDPTASAVARAQEHMRRSIGTSAGMHLAQWKKMVQRVRERLLGDASK